MPDCEQKIGIELIIKGNFSCQDRKCVCLRHLDMILSAATMTKSLHTDLNSQSFKLAIGEYIVLPFRGHAMLRPQK